MLTEKKLIGLLRKVAEETNPFSFNDILLACNIPRNSYGRDIFSYEYGYNQKSIGNLVARHPDFERFDGVCNGHVKWWCISVRERKKTEHEEHAEHEEHNGHAEHQVQCE